MNIQEEFGQITQKILDKLEVVCEKNKNKIPYTILENGNYNDLDYIDANPDLGISWWTNGFFAGILWQMYAATGDEKYIGMARVQEAKLDKCFELFEGIHHDAGFMWLLSAVADYKLTGDRKARIRGLHAATILAGRFNPNGNFIRAWNGPDGSDLNSVIIDSLMNMSLLHWAYAETKDPRFHAMAVAHTDTVAQHFVREDGSVRHIVKFDPETGGKLESLGGQGYGHGSAWSRGQAWAVYGFTNAYRHCKKEKYLQKACQTADYFIDHLRACMCVPIDFMQPEEETYEDNSAACIAACGLLELGQAAGEEQGRRYEDAALRILRRVGEKRSCLDDSMDALVTQCAVSYAERNDGAHTLIYADYFYLEAMLKLGHSALMIW